MRFLLTVVVDAVALWVATLLVPGVVVDTGGDDTLAVVVTFALLGLIFALVNAVVKPVVKFLAFPLYVLTFGLFAFVVNAFMLQITAWISDFTPLVLEVGSFFWDAVLGALVVTVVSVALGLVLPTRD